MHLCAEMPPNLVDYPLVLFELVVFVTMSRLQKIDGGGGVGGQSQKFSGKTLKIQAIKKAIKDGIKKYINKAKI